MRKRPLLIMIFLLLAAWIMLLPACSVRQSAASQPPAVPAAESAQPQSAPQTSQPTQSASSRSGAPFPDSPGSAYVVVLPGSPLPDTAYTPPAAPPRRYAEPALALIPQPDYGRIWPYFGGLASEDWENGALYGLCDEAGRVICDPVYNDAVLLERDGKQLYMLTKNLQDDEWRNVSKITLSKTDGSWVQEYDNVQYICYRGETGMGYSSDWRKDVIYEYITVYKNGKWGVIDYEGNEILPHRYNAPVCFSEGLAAVLSEDRTTYSYINRTGEEVIGPYPVYYHSELVYYMGSSPDARTNGVLFCEGLSRFVENGKFGMIDRTGAIVIPAQYDYLSSFDNGTAQFYSGGLSGIIDRNGKVLYETENIWFYKSENGEVILNTSNGDFVLALETGAETLVDMCYLEYEMRSAVPGGAIIKRTDGDLRFPDVNYVSKLDNGSFLMSSKDNTWCIINREGKTLAGPNYGYAVSGWSGYIYVYEGFKGNLSERYEMRGDKYAFFDQTGKRILPDSYQQIIPFGGRYLVRQDAFAGLIDEFGDWVIRAPLYDYLSD